MQLYEKEDEVIAQATIKSILNHLWKFCEATVIFTVFYVQLSPSTRESMIEKCLMFPPPASIPVCKLRFPADLNNKSNICDALLAFIGPRSWLLFVLEKIKNFLIG